MRGFVILLLLCGTSASYAQNEVQITEDASARPMSDEDSVRNYYIKGFPDYFFVYPVLKQRGLNFELAKRDRSSVLNYKPNNTYSLGIGLYLFELGLEFGFAIPLREQSIERFGQSDARDLHLNVLAKRWGIDALYQRYTGFYITDKENVPVAGQAFPQRPDIETTNFGLSGHYVFNHQQFSFRSAYNFSERQLYSKGSFLLFSSLRTFRVAADSSLVYGGRQASFGSEVDFIRLRFTTFSVAPGYTFNLTYNNFFLNTTFAAGPAHNWINYELEGNRSERHDIAINSFISARVAIGYNGYRVFGGISFVSEGNTIRFEDTTFSSNNSVFKVLVGYRFTEWGILKKRVWDILPFEI